uniref:Putative 10 kDa acidid metastriate family member n=1 Tax=Rhipicephalus pulchellus TaxID=72859 RepID=L7MBS8_RHIPC
MISTIACVTMLVTLIAGAPNREMLPGPVTAAPETPNFSESVPGDDETPAIPEISPEVPENQNPSANQDLSDAKQPPKNADPDCDAGVNETYVYKHCTFFCGDEAQALRNEQPCILQEQEVTSLQERGTVEATMNTGVCQEGQCVKQRTEVTTQEQDGGNPQDTEEETQNPDGGNPQDTEEETQNHDGENPQDTEEETQNHDGENPQDTDGKTQNDNKVIPLASYLK